MKLKSQGHTFSNTEIYSFDEVPPCIKVIRIVKETNVSMRFKK